MALKELIKGNEREVKDVFYLITLQGLTYVLPLLVLPYLMQVLGPKGYGYIGFSIAFMQYMMLLVDFGFNQSATKRIALAKDNREELDKIFSSTLYAKLALLVVCLGLTVVLSFIPQFQEYRSTLYVMTGTVIGQTFIFIFLFQGLGNIRYIAVVNAIAKFAVLPLTFVLVKDEGDFLIAALIQSMTSIAAAVISIIVVKKKNWVSLVKPDVNSIMIELKESFPLFLSTTASSVYTACFAIILGYFSTPYEVGLYSSSDRLMRALCFLVLAPVIQAFYPHISRMAVTDKNLAASTFKKLFLLTIAVMTLMSLFTIFLGPYAIALLRPEYNSLHSILMVMSALPIAMGMGGVAGQLGLLAIGGPQEKTMFKNTYLFAALVAIVGVFILAPNYGAMGTAIAMVVTECVVGFLMCIKAFKLLKGIKQ